MAAGAAATALTPVEAMLSLAYAGRDDSLLDCLRLDAAAMATTPSSSLALTPFANGDDRPAAAITPGFSCSDSSSQINPARKAGK